MSVLRVIESKIEGLFEGVFGRAFRAQVQPVELARKLAKEMDEHRSVSVSRVYVPNEYTVYLSTRDRDQFAAYEGSLIGELQEYLMEHARREGYALITPARVIIMTDEDLAVGEFGIATRVVEPADATPALPPLPLPLPASLSGSTTIYRSETDGPSLAAEPPAVPTPPARPPVTLTFAGRTIPLDGERVVIGRSRDCDIPLTDTNVSRRHCEIVSERGRWYVVDLGSTNGTELNGRAVTRNELADGDRITVGAHDLVFGVPGTT